MSSRKKSIWRERRAHSSIGSLPGQLFNCIALITLFTACFSCAQSVFAGTGKDFFQNTSMLTPGNYSPAVVPNNTDDVRINRSSASLTITNSTVTLESLSVVNGNTFTISNATGPTGNNSTLNVGNSAGFTNVFSSTADDLLYIGNGVLTIQGPNSGSGTAVLNLVLQSSGNFRVEAGSSLAISSAIGQSGTRSVTKTGGGSLTLSGANSYSGGTTVSSGGLLLFGSGTLGSTFAYSEWGDVGT